MKKGHRLAGASKFSKTPCPILRNWARTIVNVRVEAEFIPNALCLFT
jgi:hypothetical protein